MPYKEYICLKCGENFYYEEEIITCLGCEGFAVKIGDKKNSCWHYGSKLENGTAFIKKSLRDYPKQIIIPKSPEEITDIYTALAAILCRKINLQRVSRYYCDKHEKYHRFSFHSYVSFTWPIFVGLDTEKEVIEFAKTLFKEKK